MRIIRFDWIVIDPDLDITDLCTVRVEAQCAPRPLLDTRSAQLETTDADAVIDDGRGGGNGAEAW